MNLSELYREWVFKKNGQLVIFNTDKIEEDIGSWMGVINESIEGVSLKKREKISTQFGLLLRSIGITQNVILYDYKKDDRTFLAFLIDENSRVKRVDMTLYWSDGVDRTADIIMETLEEGSFRYTLNNYSKRKAPFLELDSYVKTNSSNGNTLHRFMSHYFYSVDVRNGDYMLTIRANNPHSESAVNYELPLPGRFDVEDYLLGISFPCNIEEVYHMLRLDEVSRLGGMVQIKLMENDKCVDKLEVNESGLVRRRITKKKDYE